MRGQHEDLRPLAGRLNLSHETAVGPHPRAGGFLGGLRLGDLKNALLNKRPDDALSRQAAGLDRLITPGLLAATALLGAGLVLPVMTVSKFFVFSDEVSIWTAITDLYNGDELFLALVVMVFSVIFPFAKISIAYGLWRTFSFEPEKHRRLVAVLDTLGRWSLADVLVVAVLIVIAKSTAFASAQMDVGLYFFAAGVGLTSMLVFRIKKAVARATP